MNWLAAALKRLLHHVPRGRRYPKVSADDVVLDKPRYGFVKQRPPLISQGVRDTLFPAEEIRARYRDAGKPVPNKYKLRSDAILRRNWERTQDEVAQGLPHFKVGLREVYFPKARVCLLRPNAKHTPYQAKFLVPRNFNKMDLRDYLWHVYGLRALNVTVQLLHARFNRSGDDYARYRGPQYKKMTIDMAEPFVWPEVDPKLVEESERDHVEEMKAILEKNRVGADAHKPREAFDGLYQPTVLPNAFVPKHQQKARALRVAAHTAALDTADDRAAVAKYLNL